MLAEESPAEREETETDVYKHMDHLLPVLVLLLWSSGRTLSERMKTRRGNLKCLILLAEKNVTSTSLQYCHVLIFKNNNNKCSAQWCSG